MHGNASASTSVLPICFPQLTIALKAAREAAEFGEWEIAMKLNDDVVADLKLPPDKQEIWTWDDDMPGFGVRMRPGSKRYYVKYRVGRQQRGESLGDPRKVKLEAARKAARRIFAKVELGEDPAATKAQAREAAVVVKLTLGSVADRYLALKESKLRPASYQAAARHFREHWKPLRNQPLTAIKRADVAARLQELTTENGHVAAARARANLSAMFGWAMREGLCDANPVLVTNNPDAGAKPRERILSDAELRAVWTACTDDRFGAIIKLLILCGCRRDEIGGLRWNEVDLAAGTMTIGGERIKNHKTLTLTMPPMALDILRAQPRVDGQVYVFPSQGGTRGFSSYSYYVLALNNRIAAANGRPLQPWTLHDLRRSMRSGLGRIGIPPHIAELVIGHARKGIEATYDRYHYTDEIKMALAGWADHVANVVDKKKSNVLAMKKKA
jgi:integrase